FSIYPNPAQSEFLINFDLATSEEINIAVVDLLGREINTVTNSNLSAGNHSYTVDVTNFANGIYFVKMESNGVNQTVKFVVAH
nr:T9SS type A sorting domain-containing protein [Chitinophagales bacterium]